MATNYTLTHNVSTIIASKEFVESCEILKNLLEDTGDNNDNNIIPIINDFTEEEFKMYIKFFENMSNLKVETKAGNIVSYLDYISNFREEYIENYTNKNLDPPHTNEVYKIFTNLGDQNVKKLIELDVYYNNPKIIKGIMLCIAISIRKLDAPKEDDETEEEFKERKNKSQSYIKAIMDCVA
jgi:hypothetical protein